MKLNDLMQMMVDKGASDLYLISGNPPAFRVDDQTLFEGSEKLNQAILEEFSRKDLLSEAQYEELCTQKEMNCAYVLSDEFRFRVNIFYQKNDLSMVFRRISSDVPQIEDLGLPEVAKELVMAKRGLILVTGATGSGKSTSMAAMIGYRNQNKNGHIVTIEDPIEYYHHSQKSLITQREVSIDTLSYKNAMKSALRQAPDVLLVGEMRDEESVRMAVNFAETGHLVISTLHSTNATQTVQRILQFFPEEQHAALCMQLAGNLNAIISQRLLPKKDGKGRVLATESMLMTPRITELVKMSKLTELKEAMNDTHYEGMHTFDRCLLKLYNDGLITDEVALANADSANNLKLELKGLSSGNIVIE